MFKYTKIGDIERIEMVEMPESTKAVLIEVLDQNNMILEANCLMLKLIVEPFRFLGEEDGVK